MLLKIVYLLMRCSFGLTVLVFRADEAKDAELLVLRHKNAVLRRHADQVRYQPCDWARFVALARFIPRTRWTGIFPMTPATLLAWHRRPAEKIWHEQPAQARPARRPAASPTYVAVRLAKGNPLWGYRRIRDPRYRFAGWHGLIP